MTLEQALQRHEAQKIAKPSMQYHCRPTTMKVRRGESCWELIVGETDVIQIPIEFARRMAGIILFEEQFDGTVDGN
jgi:phosphoribosylformylglycinamidine (FGAM) synthase-like amidotransferase family enzyme